MTTEEHQYFWDIGKEDGLAGQALHKFVREQIAEKRKYDEEQRQHELALKESEQALKASELALLDKELELERAKKESAALAAQQVCSPTPSTLNTSLSTVNNLVGKWTEDEPEQWLEEIEFLCET